MKKRPNGKPGTEISSHEKSCELQAYDYESKIEERIGLPKDTLGKFSKGELAHYYNRTVNPNITRFIDVIGVMTVANSVTEICTKNHIGLSLFYLALGVAFGGWHVFRASKNSEVQKDMVREISKRALPPPDEKSKPQNNGPKPQ